MSVTCGRRRACVSIKNSLIMKPPSLFVFGLGYVGLRVGQAAQNQLGWHVCGSCGSVEKADAVHLSTGIDAHYFDLNEEYSGLDESGMRNLMQASHLLVTVPPIADFDRDPLLALHGDAVQQAASTDGRLQWVGYLSTTSVYGDHDGAWVDETSETRAKPGSAGHHRLAAEKSWLALEGASQGRVSASAFRLAGIYGPGRSALDTVRRAAPVTAPGRPEAVSVDEASTTAGTAGTAAPPAPPPRFVSRIHVDDISAALLASMQHPPQPRESGAAGRIFNVADDDPAPRAEVMHYASTLLGLPKSAGAAATRAPSGNGGGRARRRATEHKRVSNDCLRAELLLNGLAWPSYREGLRGIFDAASEA